MSKRQTTAKEPNGKGQNPTVPPARSVPFVVTLVFDPQTGDLAITPVFEVDAQMMIRVLQKAAEQVIAFAAVENARRQAAPPAPPPESSA